jgi:hypothetical protein
VAAIAIAVATSGTYNSEGDGLRNIDDDGSGYNSNGGSYSDGDFHCSGSAATTITALHIVCSYLPFFVFPALSC